MNGSSAAVAGSEGGLGDALAHLEDARTLGAFVLVGWHESER